jgi:PTS system glucose-specific IIA component
MEDPETTLGGHTAPRQMTLDIITPMSGTVASLDSVPDPIFASGCVGGGLAIVPDPETEQVTLRAPVSGVLTRLMPHFFLIVTDDGIPVLTHLGIDTGRLDGQGYSLHASEGQRVSVGERVTTYAPRALGRLGFDPIVPVVAMQLPDIEGRLIPGEPCEPGDVLFRL